MNFVSDMTEDRCLDVVRRASISLLISTLTRAAIRAPRGDVTARYYHHGANSSTMPPTADRASSRFQPISGKELNASHDQLVFLPRRQLNVGPNDMSVELKPFPMHRMGWKSIRQIVPKAQRTCDNETRCCAQTA